MSVSLQDKQRILNAAQQGDKWKAVADALGAPFKTAYHWINAARRSGNWEAIPSARGGRRYEKVTTAMKAHLVERLEENGHLTLQELADSLLHTFEVHVTPPTVKRSIDGCGYTLKKIHAQSDSMNTMRNKMKRSEYVSSLLEYQAAQKKLFYVDETNYNVYLARTVGRSPRGSRAVSELPASKDENMHVIACISSSGLAYWEWRFGSYKAPDCKEFMRRLLRHVSQQHPLSNAVFVLDNAPAHSQVEAVFGEDEFQDARLFRLAPYSPMLNPIENVFSTFKSHSKAFLSVRRRAILRTPPNMTIKDHRLSFLINAAEVLMDEVVTERLCANCESHTLSFVHDVIRLVDMPVGR